MEVVVMISYLVLLLICGIETLYLFDIKDTAKKRDVFVTSLKDNMRNVVKYAISPDENEVMVLKGIRCNLQIMQRTIEDHSFLTKADMTMSIALIDEIGRILKLVEGEQNVSTNGESSQTERFRGKPAKSQTGSHELCEHPESDQVAGRNPVERDADGLGLRAV